MALGLQTESGGGEYNPVCKYDARAGRFFRVDRTQDSGGNWQTNNVEITNGFQAVMDLENIQVGWMMFAANIAPQFTLVPLGDPFPDKPSDNHKQGFRLMMKLGKSSGGDVREFASTAKAVIGAIDALHDQYTKEKAANPGKLPIVSMISTVPVVSQGRGQSSTNYAPVFHIEKWIDRPAELAGKAAANQPAVQQTVQAAPPAPARVAQPAMAGAEEF